MSRDYKVEKWCSAGHHAPLAEFNKDKSRTDGLAHYCRAHQRAMLTRSWRRRIEREQQGAST